MNKYIIIAFIFIWSSCNWSANATTMGRTRPDANSKPSGGIVEKPYTGNSFIFVNTQNTIPYNQVAGFVQQIRWATIMPFEARNYPLVRNIKEAQKLAKNLSCQELVGAAVVIVDIAEDSGFINYEESNWGVLNIAFLKRDAPSEEKLNERVSKALWFAAGRVLGAGYSGKMNSVLKPFNSLKELDSNISMRPSPEGFNAMIENGERLGIKTITIASYRTACYKGWAPAPTNEVQQAIWDKVHAVPQNPIKIEFDPAKGK